MANNTELQSSPYGSKEGLLGRGDYDHHIRETYHSKTALGGDTKLSSEIGHEPSTNRLDQNFDEGREDKKHQERKSDSISEMTKGSICLED